MDELILKNTLENKICNLANQCISSYIAVNKYQTLLYHVG